MGSRRCTLLPFRARRGDVDFAGLDKEEAAARADALCFVASDLAKLEIVGLVN